LPAKWVPGARCEVRRRISTSSPPEAGDPPDREIGVIGTLGWASFAPQIEEADLRGAAEESMT
jgi:hypothetical protein